ncbi:MAG TPA: Xaa-Pro peptidase family protein [Methanocorpusculum sp.]|nr:Xaa-Pro peptidase family protein [Methanocorpusculum sp.]HJJ95953.1 Xaa-Pro peptidase family protein [Methanocorpusculum sp.]
MTALDDELIRQDCDAYVIYDSSENSDMQYLSGFHASDPYIFVQKQSGERYIIVSSMEELRARREAKCNVLTRTSAGFVEFYEEYKNADLATAHMLKNLNGKKFLVPYSMPVGFANALSSVAEIKVDTNTVLSMRAVKTEDEIDKIKDVQRKNEDGVHLAINAIKKADIDEEGKLVLDGEPLTSDRLRGIIHERFYSLGLTDTDTIISCGMDTALPHAKGDGQLMAYQPIVMDVFPRDNTTGYFADMTRTVSKGKPSDEIIKMYDTVHEAKEFAASLIRAGISGADVHNAVADFFTNKNYETAGSSGFIHSLGHGVGLAIHESPSLSIRGETLIPGNVVTIEPGLYYPGIGGVRLEDMGAVTEDGFDRFTTFEEQLIIA